MVSSKIQFLIMKVLLSGFNVDVEILKKLAGKKKVALTPETLSAAYARISRSPLPVDQLRKVAREEVEKARKSNQTIIFKMGHHSVAEHAVFNFDIIGVSRLVVEEIEKFRLCSYTEKSQRYIMMGGDFVLPHELTGSPLINDYQKIIKLQNSSYQCLYKKLRQRLLGSRRVRTLDRLQLKTLENRAKEDARYVLPLATQAQLGATINGRNLELMLRRFAAHSLSEVRQLGGELAKCVKKIAPSIILFYKASDYERFRYEDLAEDMKDLTSERSCKVSEAVSLIDYTRSGDDLIIAALLRTVGKTSFETCLNRVKRMMRAEKFHVLKTALHHMQLYDTPPREFEYANLVFELIVSAACFAQLKRHRIATITSQLYNPALGVTLPDAIKLADEEKRFHDVIRQTEFFYDKIKNKDELLAQYVLTNSHRKRVLVSCNLRELYHISRLREDVSAQWDIREVVGKMVERAKEVMPLACFLIGGKDKYPEIYKNVFGKFPKVVKAELPGVKKF